MKENKSEINIGKLEFIREMCPTKIEKRYYVGFKISGEWYNLFGSEVYLKAVVSRLTVDSNVKFVFKNVNKCNPNGVNIFKDLKELSGIWLVEQDITIPVSDEWHMVKEGKLSLSKLRGAIECFRSDCIFILSELENVQELEECIPDAHHQRAKEQESEML